MRRDPVLEVLTAYPQVYHACHLRHARARSTTARISERDAVLLGHLDLETPVRPLHLARHLSLRPSTVSEAVKRLVRLGYVLRRTSAADRRRAELLLLPKGAAALKAVSILDAGRVELLLTHLSAPERTAAVRGLSLLARGARALVAADPGWHPHGGRT